MPPKKASSAVASAPSGRPQRAKRAAADEPADVTTANTAKKRKTAPTKVDKKSSATKPATVKKASGKTAATKAITAAKNAANTSKKRKVEDDEDEQEKRPAKKATTTKSAPKKAIGVKKEISKLAVAKKAAPKKTAPSKSSAKKSVEPAETSEPELKTGPVINQPPTQRLDVLVFGEGSAGELGLGTLKNAVDVKRPRLNPNLLADKVGIVQIAAGGMHVVALTADNKILTWGVNDNAALGRDTTWEGGLRDMDEASDSGSDSGDDSGLNPKEANPGEVDWSTTPLVKDTRWAFVAAGDSTGFAVTDDGRVYGWGTFRNNEGKENFTTTVKRATRPVPIPELRNITSIACGTNHALALDNKGAVWAWGSYEQSQLGRRVVERNRAQALIPHQVGFPRAARNKVKSIASGDYHSFAITDNGDLYAWGLNAWGETGIIQKSVGEDEAVVTTAQLVKALQGKAIISVAAGTHHSLAAIANGDCLIWGKCIDGQVGIAREELLKLGDAVRKDPRGHPALLTVPTKVPEIEGHATVVSAGSDVSIIVTKEGQAYSTGFSGTYATGLGTDDDVHEFTLIDNTATRDRTISGVQVGGQFSMLTAAAK